MVNKPGSRVDKKINFLNFAGTMKEGDFILPTPLSEQIPLHLKTLLSYTYFAESYIESGIRAVFDSNGKITGYMMKGDNSEIQEELKQIKKELKEMKDALKIKKS